MANRVQASRPSTSALAVMREWSAADFRANAFRILLEAGEERFSYNDARNPFYAIEARRYLAQARMVRECAAILAPSRLP